MLPSTGYFKGINCPFYDNGLCDRPYCHFRHVKKESQNTTNEGIESGAILQKLVSAAVQKVLRSSDVSSETFGISSDANQALSNELSVHKATYNPTPISELKKINNIDSENPEDVNEQRKRHIPVPYTPRKPASLIIKRPVVSNGDSVPFVFVPPPAVYTPGSVDSSELDQYTPKGSLETTSGKYLPGSEIEIQEYEPDATQKANKHNYVPSDKSVSKIKTLEYKPTKVSSKALSNAVTYQPTPRTLVPCFSSDEEEPLRKKIKISSDLNGLDDLGPEFDILDQILHEEKSNVLSDVKIQTKNESIIPSEIDNEKSNERKIKEKCKSNNEKDTDNGVKKKGTGNKVKEKSEDTKINDKSHKKDKSEKSKRDHKEHSRSKNREKLDSKIDSKKSSTNQTHKERKEKEDRSKKEKHSSEKKHHSSTSSRDSSKSNILKSKDKDSKHSSKSKSDAKSKHDHDRKRHKSSKDRNSREKIKDNKKKEKSSNSDDDNVLLDDLNSENGELYESSESDEERRAQECKKIFEEYVPTPINKSSEDSSNKVFDSTEEEYVPSKKRISRTTHKNVKVIPKAPVKPDFKVNAAQAMAERLAKVKEYHASKIKTDAVKENSSKTDLLKTVHSAPNTGSTKIRIAHVPYASTLMNAKKTISPIPNVTKSVPSTSATISQTVKKGIQRVAHIPNEKFIDRPGVLEPLGSKIAANIRSTYLNMMIDECLKIYLLPTDAYARAQNEELSTSKKCSTVQIYKNSAVLTVSRLRKEFQECNGVKKSGVDCISSHKGSNTLSGNTGGAGSWSIESKNRHLNESSKELSGTKLYINIQKWILTEEQLKENGFPRPHPSGDKGRAIIYGQKKQNPPKGFIRTCCRCKKEYTVNKLGLAAVKEECIYHPNKKYKVRGEARYQCCGQDGTSDGCCVAPSHVYEYVDYENLKGYVKTMTRSMEYYGIYSLDCEMCYTTHGLDLTRVTVIDTNCKVVYETLVKPLHPIVDYNTRYSGITEEQMVGVKTTLLDVQAALLTMFNSKTILIGHSLESDFKALKLIHDTVIDTSVIFPHKMGPPFKRALRNLSSEYLKKIIQNSIDGHDSAEDATVCMELIVFKLKEDLKTR